MAYVFVEDGVVKQKQPNLAEGFIESPSYVVPGYLYDSSTGEFTAPDTSPTDQELRNSLAEESHNTLSSGHDAQQQEYERDVRLGNTPQADSYTYTARDGSSYSGRDALDRWGNDLREIVREASKGTLDPNSSLPTPPSA